MKKNKNNCAKNKKMWYNTSEKKIPFEDDIDYERAFVYSFILMAAILMFYSVLKLFGFEFLLSSNNVFLIYICGLLDNNIIPQNIVYFVFSSIYVSLFVLGIIREFWFKKWWQPAILYTLLFISVWVKDVSPLTGLVFDFLLVIALPFILLKLNAIKTIRAVLIVLINNVLLVIFQFVSVWLRNISFGIITQNESVIITILLTLDLVIMLCIVYLFTNYIKYKQKRTVTKMGKIFVWLYGKDKKSLIKMKEARFRKIKILQEEIAEIDEMLKDEG